MGASTSARKISLSNKCTATAARLNAWRRVDATASESDATSSHPRHTVGRGNDWLQNWSPWSGLAQEAEVCEPRDE